MLNSWAYPQRALDLLDFACMDRPCERTERLRSDFRFLTEAVVDAYWTAFHQKANLVYNQTKDVSASTNDNEFSHYMDTIGAPLARKMATIHKANDMYSRLMTNRLKAVFVDEFAKQTMGNVSMFVDTLWKPVVDKIFELANISLKLENTNTRAQEILDPCYNEAEECRRELAQSYATVRLPYVTTQRGGLAHLRFGQFLSYFSRLVTKDESGKFLSQKHVSKPEQEIEDYFKSIWSALTRKKDVLKTGPSIFEIPGILHFSKKEFAPRMLSATGCIGDVLDGYVKRWKEIAAKATSYKVEPPPCTDLAQEKRLGHDKCCQITDDFHLYLRQIYKVMMYARQADEAKFGMQFPFTLMLKSYLVK